MDLSKLHVDRWFDKSTQNWICTLRDADGNQVGDSIVVGRRSEALQVRKEDFSIPDQELEKLVEEDRYGFDIPPEFRMPVRKLLRLVEEHPNKIQVWDVKTKSLMFIIGTVQSATRVSTQSTKGRGVCGVVPILRSVKARAVRLWLLGHGEVTYRHLT